MLRILGFCVWLGIGLAGGAARAELTYSTFDAFDGATLDTERWVVQSNDDSGTPDLGGFTLANGVLTIDNQTPHCRTWEADNWTEGGCASRLVFRELALPFAVRARFRLSEEGEILSGGGQTGIWVVLEDQNGQGWNFGLHLGEADWREPPLDIDIHFYQINDTRTPALWRSGQVFTALDQYRAHETMELTLGADIVDGKLSFIVEHNGTPVFDDINARIDEAFGAHFREQAFRLYPWWYSGVGAQFWMTKDLATSAGVLADVEGSRSIMELDRVDLGRAASSTPIAYFGVNQVSGHAPLELVLDYGNSQDPDGEIVDYAWTLNGGALPPHVDKGTTKTLVLDTPGDHGIQLTVTDDQGLTDTVQRTVTVLPTSDSAQTLILTNYQKLVEHYGSSRADALMSRLNTLAAHDRVQGQVIKVEEDAATATAYAQRGTDYASRGKANQVAAAIRQQIQQHWNSHGNTFQYLVLAGDDRIMPFYRVGDLTSVPDPDTLTDNYYADYQPTPCNHCSVPYVYVPDIAVGRLVETPEQMTEVIDGFFARPVLQLDQGAVSGHAADAFGNDFIGDGARAVCLSLQGGDVATDCTYVGLEGERDPFLQALLHTDHDVKSINAHANHAILGHILATDVLDASADFAGRLVYSLGCHAGQNLPDTLDLTESFAQQGASYTANTGFGWGGSGVILSEQLLHLFSEQLVSGNATLGQALMRAKQNYHASVRADDSIWRNQPDSWPWHEKVASELTLYGLPMQGIEAPAAKRTPVTRSLRSITTLAGGAQRTGLSYNWASPTPVAGDSGSYFTLAGQVTSDLDAPILPQLSQDITVENQDLHGVVFRGGSYNQVNGAPPLQRYVTTTGQASPTADFAASGWYPSTFFADNTVRLRGGDLHSLIAAAGQYHPGSGEQRIFSRMDFDAYHHPDSQDWTPPTLYLTDYSLSGNSGSVSVATSDASGIAEVVVAHTDGAGQWNSVNLSPAGGVQWHGAMAANGATEFFVQSVDQAGNVAILDGAGSYFRFAEAFGSCVEVEGTVTVPDNTLYTGTSSCHATHSLVTGGTVQVGSATNSADVTYSAGARVQLLPGFSVQPNSRFHAHIR